MGQGSKPLASGVRQPGRAQAAAAGSRLPAHLVAARLALHENNGQRHLGAAALRLLHLLLWRSQVRRWRSGREQKHDPLQQQASVRRRLQALQSKQHCKKAGWFSATAPSPAAWPRAGRSFAARRRAPASETRWQWAQTPGVVGVVGIRQQLTPTDASLRIRAQAV